MASDYVDEVLRDERESFKRKEVAAKRFDSCLDGFRKAAKALRESAAQLESVFPGMSQKSVADKWRMTSTEKNVSFDKKAVLTMPPAAEKKTVSEPVLTAEANDMNEPENAVDVGPGAAESEPSPQTDPFDGQDPSNGDRPAWMGA